MDLEYLKKNASWYAYELRKFFPEDEAPVATYVCEKEVVVLSTKKLYIYYYANMIDCVFEFLEDVSLTGILNDEYQLTVTLMRKTFHLQFSNESEYKMFIMYYEKYRN